MEDEIPKDVAAESGLDEVYDETHNDPSADVILVSSDNVSFRLSSWYLKQKSGFVRDLLGLPSSQSISHSPIPIDQQARHVRLFIDMIYSSNVATIPVDHQDLKPLLSICEHMQADSLRTTLWAGFRKTLARENSLPLDTLWEIFGMATRQNDHMACSDIMKAFSEKNVSIKYVTSRPPESYEGIPYRYLITLLQGNYRNTHTYDKQDAYKMVGWLDISRRFAKMEETEGHSASESESDGFFLTLFWGRESDMMMGAVATMKNAIP